MADDAPRPHRFRHHPLLGTVVETAILGGDAERAARLDELVVEEMARLEKVFNVFDPDSELSRWKRDEVAEPSPELVEVLGRGLEWTTRSKGRFNPLAGVLTRRWKRAEAQGRLPSDDELASLAASIAQPRYVIEGGRLRRTGDCTDLQFNAFVKGWIVDRGMAAGSAAADPSTGVFVSAGGDLAYAGPGVWPVAIENPHRPYDNEPPLLVTSIAGQGLATSGRARRGFRIDGEWFAHVLDPRTGRPVDAVASISVRADDAATADVVATISGLEPPSDSSPEPWRQDPAVPGGVDVFVVTADERHWGSV